MCSCIYRHEIFRAPTNSSNFWSSCAVHTRFFRSYPAASSSSFDSSSRYGVGPWGSSWKEGICVSV